MGVPDKEVHGDGVPPDRPELSLAGPGEHATTDTLTAAVEGRCVNCDAPLAPDQRYCVQCGQRRGRSRFALARGAEAPAASAAPPRSDPPRGRGSSAGTTVVAGIATLVLAMGVGVEIGRISNNNNPAQVASTPKPEVINVNGGGSSAAQSTTTAAARASSGGKSSSHSGKSHGKNGKNGKQTQTAAASTPKPTAKATQKASSAAKSVLGGSNGQSNATVTSGQSCSSGSAGCQGGHFTGNYFGQ